MPRRGQEEGNVENRAFQDTVLELNLCTTKTRLGCNSHILEQGVGAAEWGVCVTLPLTVRWGCQGRNLVLLWDGSASPPSALAGFLPLQHLLLALPPMPSSNPCRQLHRTRKDLSGHPARGNAHSVSDRSK